MNKEFEKMISEITSLDMQESVNSDDPNESHITYTYNWGKKVVVRCDERKRTSEHLKSEIIRRLLNRQCNYNKNKAILKFAVIVCFLLFVMGLFNV